MCIRDSASLISKQSLKIVLPTDRQAAAPKPWIHLSINKISILDEYEAANAEIEYIVAPNIKIGFLPYLSENGPDKICPRAKKVKYKVKTSWVSENEISKSFFIRVNAGEIIVIPITGTATITANKLIFGFVKYYRQSN